MTDRPALAVICTSRPRSFPVGMPATVRRNVRPRFPREGGSRAVRGPRSWPG